MRTLRFVFLATIAAIVVAFGGVSQVRAVTRPFSSGFQVQNLGSTDATIEINLYNEDGSTAAQASDTVPGNGQVTYATLDKLSPQAPPTGFSGSAVISSSERVAAIVNLVSPDISLSFGGEAYIGFDAGSQNVRLPLLFKASNGFSTFFNVQNVGDSTATVNITYQNGATESTTIAPSAAKRFDQDQNANLPAGFAGSATITSNQDVVATVVQVGPTTVLVYNGFTQTSQNPYFPLINANNGGFITGVSLQNAGTESTNVTVSYTPSSNGTACAETQTIPAGEARFFAINAFLNDTNGDDCANGSVFVGSARVTANSASQPLVGIVNQLNQAVNKGGSYAAFDPSAATSTVVYPLIQDRIAGYFTGFSIVNVGSSATTVTCTYSNSSVTQSQSLEPNETFTAQQANVIGNGYNGSGTCQASGSGQIIGIANQLLFAGTRDTFFVYEGINN